MSLPLLTYKGTWYSVPNSPLLSDGTGTAGDTYRIINGNLPGVAPYDIFDIHNVDLGSGLKSWITGSYVYYTGSVWKMVGDF